MQPPTRWGPQSGKLARAAGIAVVGLALVVAALAFLLPLLGQGAVYLIELLATISVELVTSIGTGVSVWGVLGTIVKAGATALMTPTGSGILALVVIIGFLAMYWLLRLLESEKER